jgi:hypothetical protein
MVPPRPACFFLMKHLTNLWVYLLIQLSRVSIKPIPSLRYGEEASALTRQRLIRIWGFAFTGDIIKHKGYTYGNRC